MNDDCMVESMVDCACGKWRLLSQTGNHTSFALMCVCVCM